MKRPPNRGESMLVHETTTTGDIQCFALSADNFDPSIIARMEVMEREPLAGYRLLVTQREPIVAFAVMREDGTVLTHNTASMERGPDGRAHIVLSTSVTETMPPEESFMLADLEQCAALMLLRITCG